MSSVGRFGAVWFALTVAAPLSRAQRTPVESREAVLVFSGGDSLFKVIPAHPLDVPRDLEVLPNGSIAMLTRNSLHVFDASGRTVRRLDTRAGTRGALVDAVDLVVNGQELMVRETRPDQWKIYTLGGQFVETREIPAVQPVRRVITREGTSIIERSPLLPPVLDAPPRDQSYARTISVQRGNSLPVRLFDMRADSVYFRAGYDTLAVVSRAQLNGRRTARPMPSRFGAGGAWAVRGDSELVHIDGGSGAVTWYRIGASGAEIVERGSLGRSSRPVTPDDIDDERARLQRVAVAAAPASYDDRARISAPMLAGTPEYWSVATRAIYADDGTLWVGVNRIYTDSDERGEYLVRIGDENTWTVFPPRGTGPAFTVSLRPRFRLTAIRNGRLYGFVDSGIGAPVVEVYTVPGPDKSTHFPPTANPKW